MATHCQTAAWSRSGEHQHLGVVEYLEGEKKRGGGGSIQTKNLIRVVTCKTCLFSLYFTKYIIFIMKCGMEELESPLYTPSH